MPSSLSVFLTGLFIGGGASLLGAALSYWFGLAAAQGEDDEPTSVPIVYLFLVTIILSAIGAVALIATFFNQRSAAHVLLTGAGVVTGFTLVFSLLLFIYLQQE
ncbi:MAG: hypothetical protein KDD92_13625 [Caldilineaceae bacterium]|nr:hypothetical protein [Caldilineaceae bacterium]